jgi:hypothetical protein
VVLVGLGFTDDGADGGGNGAFSGQGDGLGGDAAMQVKISSMMPRPPWRPLLWVAVPDRRTETILVGEAWDWSVRG